MPGSTIAQSEGQQLFKAADLNNIDEVERLLRNGADVNAANSKGTTALILAANNGHVDCLKVLLKHGADVNVADNDGATPFIYSAMEGHVDCIEVLLKHGVEVDASDDEEITSLVEAAIHKHESNLENLPKHDAPGKKRKLDHTPNVSSRNLSTGALECGICLSPMGGDADNSVAAPLCGHVYCYDCLVRIDIDAKGRDSSATCPTCRQAYSEIDIRRVYIP